MNLSGGGGAGGGGFGVRDDGRLELFECERGEPGVLSPDPESASLASDSAPASGR